MSEQLYEAFRNNASSEQVQELLQLYPEAVEEVDNFGLLPLHLALWCRASPEIINMIFKAYPKAVEVQNDRGELPLHYALNYDASPDIINMLFQAYPQAAEVQASEYGMFPLHYALRHDSDIITMLFNAYREAAKVQDKDGWMPLHYAIAYNDSPDIITMLFQAYPQAVEVQDSNGRLPLHYACMSEIHFCDNFLEVLNLLISAYPEGIGTQDYDGKLPSDFFKQAASESNHVEHLYLLHEAVKARFSLHLIKLLLQAFPESCVTKDDFGMVPLHHACVSNAINHLEVVITLFDANEDSIKIEDSQGRTPMQVLQHTASHQAENKIFPLHHLAATSDNLKVKSLQLLVNVFPESIQTPDKNGMLPFHHACLNQALSLEVLMLFISLYPEALKYF